MKLSTSAISLFQIPQISLNSLEIFSFYQIVLSHYEKASLISILIPVYILKTSSAFLTMQERAKALGYITMNQRATEQALELMDEEALQRPPDNINEITIKISRCMSLLARREGNVVHYIILSRATSLRAPIFGGVRT